MHLIGGYLEPKTSHFKDRRWLFSQENHIDSWVFSTPPGYCLHQWYTLSMHVLLTRILVINSET